MEEERLEESLEERLEESLYDLRVEIFGGRVITLRKLLEEYDSENEQE